MLHQQPTLAEMRAALRATKLPAEEHFAQMIKRGLINKEGQLTRLYGGSAEPESSANGGPLRWSRH